MKCLFLLSNSPLAQNYTGAAARYLQAFLALTQLGVEVHVLRFLSEDNRQRIIAFEQAQPRSQVAHYGLAQSWRDVDYTWLPRFQRKLEGIWRGLFRPVEYQFPETKLLLASLLTSVDSLKPDFILAEMTVAGALVTVSGMDLPWIYGHHDWIYRDKMIRRALRVKRVTLGNRFSDYVARRAEIAVARNSTTAIAASQIEGEEMERLGVQNVHVIPTTYESVPSPSADYIPQQPIRIVHFGNLKTTANAVGLCAYLEKVVPMLPENWGLHIVGAADEADPALLDKLDQVGATLVGYVADLGTVLRPFDIAIIPYEHNTGVRTKLPLLFNYAQVVVATEAAVAGSLEARPGENCFVLPSLEHFPDILRQLASEPMLRNQIGLEAKRTFERTFTLEAQLPKYERVLSYIAGCG
jgi:hypothetical protein